MSGRTADSRIRTGCRSARSGAWTAGAPTEALFDSELLGMHGQLTRRSPFALLDGEMERAYRAGILPRFGGGANEVRRDIIARRGLGMTRDAAAADRDRQPAEDVRSPQTATGRA